MFRFCFKVIYFDVTKVKLSRHPNHTKQWTALIGRGLLWSSYTVHSFSISSRSIVPLKTWRQSARWSRQNFKLFKNFAHLTMSMKIDYSMKMKMTMFFLSQKIPASFLELYVKVFIQSFKRTKQILLYLWHVVWSFILTNNKLLGFAHTIVRKLWFICILLFIQINHHIIWSVFSKNIIYVKRERLHNFNPCNMLLVDAIKWQCPRLLPVYYCYWASRGLVRFKR